MFTPKRRDVITGEVKTHTVTPDRSYFDAIIRQLAKSDEASRVRYVRQSEQPFTLQDLINFSCRTSREIGIFLDKFVVDSALIPANYPRDKYLEDNRYTAICLYAGGRMNLGGNTQASLNTGADVSFPPFPKNTQRYRIIAHVHPTESVASHQITRDMKVASDEIEMVVTWGGSIFYYSEGQCYNAFYFANGVKQYHSILNDPAKSDFAFELDTPITEDAVTDRLDNIGITPATRINSGPVESAVNLDFLLGDENPFENGSSDSDSSEGEGFSDDDSAAHGFPEPARKMNR